MSWRHARYLGDRGECVRRTRLGAHLLEKYHGILVCEEHAQGVVPPQIMVLHEKKMKKMMMSQGSRGARRL